MSEIMEKRSDIKTKSSRRRYKITNVAISLLLIMIAIFILFMREQKPDLASEKVIREIAVAQLNKDPNKLTYDDFAKITELTIAEEKVIKNENTGEINIFLTSIELHDIKLLEKFTNLQKLDMRRITFPYNKIPIWMKFLEDRGFGDLYGKMTIDLSPLEKLNQLEELKIEGSSIKNIKPLAKLTNLKKLELAGTRVTNLKPIKNLTKLQSLTIKNSPVRLLRPIKNLTNLKTLSLYDCHSILNNEIEDLKKALPDLVVIKHISPSIGRI